MSSLKRKNVAITTSSGNILKEKSWVITATQSTSDYQKRGHFGK
jgi:hypothetical protein